jgi:hypothetical protein
VGPNPGAGKPSLRPFILAPGVDTPPLREALRPDRVLVRYGELGLKSPKVRGRFLQRLNDAIIMAFQREGVACVVEHDQGHVYVHADDLARAVGILTTVFGVVSVSPVATTPASDLKALGEAVARYSRPMLSPGQSFAIRSRRVGKHAYTSQEAAAAAGAAVRRAFGDHVRVDLGDPDVAIELEVRGERAYIYHERMPGTGGLPPGSQGRVLCPLRTRHDAVACWLLMRRGCEAVVVVPAGDAGAAALAGAMRRWAPALRVREVAAGEWGWPALYRELGRTRCLAVVVGARGPEVPELPPDRGAPPVAMFPLVGLDDAALGALEERVLGGARPGA